MQKHCPSSASTMTIKECTMTVLVANPTEVCGFSLKNQLSKVLARISPLQRLRIAWSTPLKKLIPSSGAMHMCLLVCAHSLVLQKWNSF